MNDTAVRARELADLLVRGVLGLAQRLSGKYADRITGWLSLPSVPAEMRPFSELVSKPVRDAWRHVA
jgi:hypothetical protein